MSHIEPLERRMLLASVPAGFTDQVFATGLHSPTAMEFAPDGRLFVCEQTGAVRVIQNGQLLPAPFLTLDVDSTGERGLLGIAFDPNFQANHYVYLYHTVPGNNLHNQVSRITANGDVAVSGSEADLFDLDPLDPAHSNHNGGGIHFGPDGMLYVGVGENGAPANAQSLQTTLGKILRINPDGSIPADNPFYSQTTGNNRAIWAIGLRNPYTFAFQPGTGRMFINDVGQNTWEEIDDGIAAGNYGWPATEGPTADPRFRAPIFAYMHGAASSDGGIAITGGTFYNPPAAPFPTAFNGTYFFADLGGGWVHNYNPTSGKAAEFATGFDQPVDVKTDSLGDLFVLSYGEGAVHEISYAAPSIQASIASPAEGQQYTAGARVRFAGQATLTGNTTARTSISLSWQVVYFKGGQESGTLVATSSRDHGSFLIPRTETDPADFYRVILTATVSGTSTSVARDIHPKFTSVDITSNVPGARFTVDGQEAAAPEQLTGVIGSAHSILVPSPQEADGGRFMLLGGRNYRILMIRPRISPYLLRFRRVQFTLMPR